jgi:hypothetical protein
MITAEERDRALHIAYYATGHLGEPQFYDNVRSAELGGFVLAAMGLGRADLPSLVGPLIDAALRCDWTPRAELIPFHHRDHNGWPFICERLPEVEGLVRDAARATQQLRDENGPARLIYIRALLDLWRGAFFTRAELRDHPHAAIGTLGLLAEVNGAIEALADPAVVFPDEGW